MKGFRTILAVIVASGAMAVLATPAQAAKFYKWVDEKGVTHYTEKAPADTKTTTVKVGDTTSSDAEDAIKALNEKRSAADTAKKKDAEDTGSGQSADANDQNKKLCDQHRKNLATLKSGNRILTKDEKGNQRYLTEQEIAAQLKTSEDEVKRCDEHKIPAGPGAAPSASKFGP